ncbi:hypothetical protein SA2016_1051 [Sinomonas atrocyanea]|uniref:Uncharacterized protein n=1 Tax=Sinomonas atrocyanea TaxID=37927 RepID=A0A126ZYU1_9MICC|nr:hypothetical protein [Sinomonas atrocyanea]AMM31734.1 hypothetical protein SA2016_1051 [Sinomonas atrocyanea]GEB66481.1 hypothetical protein SAT01_39290 [Sinomonas atrocyanea]GGG59682.1 hypothetical protein GCM10007172_08150 [Sinomonas atrocyanea]
MGRRHYRVRHRRRIGQNRSALVAPRPTPARDEPQPVLEWAALRRVRPLPLAALVLRWLLVAALCLAVLDVARAGGVPIVLIVLVWTWSAAVRGRRRDGRRTGDRARPEVPAARHPSHAAPARPPSPARPPAPEGPPRGSPYDLETYLRRLGEDHR